MSTFQHFLDQNKLELSTKAIADYICSRLYKDVTIHRYESHSTDSIYLKFDYGVAYSLRISDHKGKNHLDYRYNILIGLKKPYRHVTGKGNIKDFYTTYGIDDCVRAILLNKDIRKHHYKDYNEVVERYKKSSMTNPKWFWKQARLYTEDPHSIL